MDNRELPPQTSNFYCLPGRAGGSPIILAAKGIADVGSSLSSGVCESAMDVCVREKEVIKAKSADDRVEQQTQGGVPYPPERRQVSGVEHLLRGKTPGTPG